MGTFNAIYGLALLAPTMYAFAPTMYAFAPTMRRWYPTIQNKKAPYNVGAFLVPLHSLKEIN